MMKSNPEAIFYYALVIEYYGKAYYLHVAKCKVDLENGVKGARGEGSRVKISILKYVIIYKYFFL